MKPKFRAGIDDPQIFFEEEFMEYMSSNSDFHITNGNSLLHYLEDGTYFEAWFKDYHPDEWEADNKKWEEHQARVMKNREEAKARALNDNH